MISRKKNANIKLLLCTIVFMIIFYILVKLFLNTELK
jgi:hypothetical protein